MARETVFIDNVRAVEWVNFSGENRNGFNPLGKKSFDIVLYPEDADRLEAENVYLKERVTPDGEVIRSLNVKVNFHVNPFTNEMEPAVFSVIDGKKIELDEEMAKTLDRRNIVGAHISFNKNPARINGKEMYTAYLRRGYFIINPNVPQVEQIVEDPWEDLYK